MEVLKEIGERFSPREFSEKDVEKEKIDILIEAARRAPSSYNNQPWRYVFVSRDDSSRSDFEEALVGANSWAKAASHLVAIFAREKDDPVSNEIPYYIYDTGQATMALVIEGEHQGLKTHQMSGFIPERAKSALNIPEEYKVIALMAIGYPKEGGEDKGNPDRKTSEEIAHFGKFKE